MTSRGKPFVPTWVQKPESPKKPGNVITFRFPDGEEWSTTEAELYRAEADQLRLLLEGKRDAARVAGKKGGRPKKSGPSERDIATMILDRVARTGDDSIEGWNRAQTWAVGQLAGRYSVDDKTARRWINDVLGEKVRIPKKPKRHKKEKGE